MLQRAGRSLGHWLRHWPRRKIIAWGAGSLAVLLIGVSATGDEILHHFNTNIPACEMGNGQVSAPTQFKINEAFAIGNLDGNHTSLGVACTVKAVEQDTGIYINHFVVVNFSGFKDMVA